MKKLLGTLLLGSALCALSASLAAATAHANPGATEVQGVLIDRVCSSKAETRVVGDRLEGGMVEAYVHTKKCLLMPECQKSGYGVFTYDQKYLTFDPAGNRKALALIESSKKEDDYRVEVTGEVKGDTIKVISLKLL